MIISVGHEVLGVSGSEIVKRCQHSSTEPSKSVLLAIAIEHAVYFAQLLFHRLQTTDNQLINRCQMLTVFFYRKSLS